MATTARRSRRNVGRRWIGIASASLVLGGAVAVPAGAATPPGFLNGEAEASADTFSVAVKQGNANIAISMGSSTSNYRDITGTAEARGVDMGVLQLLFGQQQCDGSPPILNPASFTAPSRTDSTDPESANSRRVEAFMPGFGSDGPGATVGFQDATATPLPASRSTTETPLGDVFVLAVTNGRTESTTSLENGTRTAHASSTADELRVFGGLFTFKKPRWEAIARSGAITTDYARFTFESATVLGFQRSHDDAMADLAEFERGLEELLRPFGVQLDLPIVEQSDGRSRITPMSFRIENMPIGAEVIAPLLGQVRPFREQMERELLAEDCKNESALLLMDVLLGVLAGSGSVEIHAGGASASTAATDFSSPPLDLLSAESLVPVEPVEVPELAPVSDLPLTTGGDLVMGMTTELDTGFDHSAPAVESLPSMPAALPRTSSTTQRARNEYAAAPAARSSRDVGTAGALAVAVGAIGLVAALGLSGGERLLSRRTRRVMQ